MRIMVQIPTCHNFFMAKLVLLSLCPAFLGFKFRHSIIFFSVCVQHFFVEPGPPCAIVLPSVAACILAMTPFPTAPTATGLAHLWWGHWGAELQPRGGRTGLIWPLLPLETAVFSTAAAAQSSIFPAARGCRCTGDRCAGL